jgi:hypothetical protein
MLMLDGDHTIDGAYHVLQHGERTKQRRREVSPSSLRRDAYTLLAAGLISLLQDSDPEIQSYAIEELDKVVGMYWAEISDHVVEM